MTRDEAFKYLYEYPERTLKQTKKHNGEDVTGFFYIYNFNGRIFDKDGDLVGKIGKNDKSEFEWIPGYNS